MDAIVWGSGTVLVVGVAAIAWRLFNRASAVKTPAYALPTKPRTVTEARGRLLELYVKEWQVVIQTQMHFNDLIVRFRSVALTSFVALTGAVITISHAPGMEGKPLTALRLMPIVFWATALVIDLLYYHQLLLGAVAEAAKFDESDWLQQLGLFGLTKCIRQHATPKVSVAALLLFYLAPLSAAFGALLIWRA